MSILKIKLCFFHSIAGKNPMDKPRLVKSIPCHIDKISVALNPSIEKFEEELCRQLNEDRINRENKVADGTTISVQERRLQVRIHVITLIC